MIRRTLSISTALALGSLFAFNAHAAVIYTNLSSSPIVVDANSSNSGQVLIDLDGDTSTDIYLIHSVTTSGSDVTTAESYIQVSASGSLNEGSFSAYVDPYNYPYALPMLVGSSIDSSLTYEGGAAFLGRINNSDVLVNTGYWANGGLAPIPGNGLGYRGYTGFAVELTSDSFTHYGWADLEIRAYDVNDFSSYAITLYGYAYESEAYKGILVGQTADIASVPEPSSLLLLAAGAAGWRMRKRPG